MPKDWFAKVSLLSGALNHRFTRPHDGLGRRLFLDLFLLRRRGLKEVFPSNSVDQVQFWHGEAVRMHLFELALPTIPKISFSTFEPFRINPLGTQILFKSRTRRHLL